MIDTRLLRNAEAFFDKSWQLPDFKKIERSLDIFKTENIYIRINDDLFI